MDERQINTTLLNISRENLDDIKRLAAMAVSTGEEGTLRRNNTFLGDDTDEVRHASPAGELGPSPPS